MKTEDFDRLKQICDENGFEFHLTDRSDEQVSIIIQKKDPWEGVEFIEKKEKGEVWVRKVLQPILPHHNAINFQVLSDENTDGCGYAHKDFVKPSTETAYVEQLKEQAFMRFGEIRAGDRFEREYCELNPVSTIRVEFEPVFRYYKDSDSLTFQGTGIYQQGKWATKIEGIEVTKSVNFYNWYTDDYRFCFHLSKQIENASDVHSFLTEQLENYLNERPD